MCRRVSFRGSEMDVEGGAGEETDGKRKKYRLQNKPAAAALTSGTSSQDSGNGSFEESEGKLDGLSSIERHEDGESSALHTTFRFTYLGNALVDRRYTQSMLPWVISEVKRRKERVEIHLNVEFMTVKALDLAGGLVFQHRVQTITRCARSRDKKCFAYLTKGSADNCYCYAFEVHDTTSLSGFVGCIKQAAKQQTGDAKYEDVPSNHEVPQSPAVKHTLWYVGRVVVSHRQAPPTLIDDFVRRFRNLRKSNSMDKELKCKEKPETAGKKSAQSSPVVAPKKPHATAFKTQSLESGMFSGMGRMKVSLEPPRELVAAGSRPRSASDGDQKKMHYSSKDDNHHNLVISRSHSRAASFGNEAENRNVAFHITDHSVTIVGLVSKVVLMEKRLKDISFCQQGSENSDHFGFICHEGKTSQFVCYIFKGQSVQMVDSVMRSLKQAFHIAWQATGPTSVCEMCPLHHLHQLCVQLEGLTTTQLQHDSLQKHLTNLSDEELNDFTDKFKVEGPLENAEEENEVVMAILRGLYEKRQQHHTHTTQAQPVKDVKPSPGLLQKAKKSFDTFLRGRSKSTFRGDEEGSCGDDTPRRSRSSTEGCLSPNSPTPPMSPIDERPPRNSELASSLAYGRARKPGPVGGGSRLAGHQSDTSPGPSPPRSPVKPTGTRTRRSSYRQVIFHSIVAPPKKSSVSSHDGDGTSESDLDRSPSRKRTKEEVQGLWRKAIVEQILLNRMEKENKTLKVYQDVSELRRLKLAYEEPYDCPKAASERWDKILSSQGATLDFQTLEGAVRAGVPKARRGEAWKLLISQHQLRAAAVGSQAWQAVSYRELKDGLSNQQHSIFIDLGRTFPSHPYFADQLGHGQICLFNLLKAYSVLDRPVGYCQGLSFVAGLLLMHLEEEDAFEALRHLMYAHNVRQQYKADMQELQMRFYKLTRLLHDRLEPVYDLLEELNVSPTLYAAPWFLTIFASHFPIGFVVRVIDLIFLEGMDVVFKIVLVLLKKAQKELLDADGFEGVVECMKTFLPTLAVRNVETIVAEALKIDVSKELESYEVEYQIFQEEGMSIASFEELESQRIASLEAENMVLSRQVHDLSENLSCYRGTVESLEGSITTLQMNQLQLQEIIRSLRQENTELKTQLEKCNSESGPSEALDQNQHRSAPDQAELGRSTAGARSGSRELNTSFTEENTDSYEHIDENDVTDDEAETISRDSPANGISEMSSSSLAPARKTEDTVNR